MAGLLNQQSSRKRMKKFSGKREFRPAQLIKGQINWMVSSPKEGEQTVYKYMEKNVWHSYASGEYKFKPHLDSFLHTTVFVLAALLVTGTKYLTTNKGKTMWLTVWRCTVHYKEQYMREGSSMVTGTAAGTPHSSDHEGAQTESGQEVEPSYKTSWSTPSDSFHPRGLQCSNALPHTGDHVLEDVYLWGLPWVF